MKMRKLTLVLAIVMLASTLAPALAKSPFADVPADHWAYDAIVELAAAGLIEGYPDGTYGGARMMTRYEAAMVFARALTRMESRFDILPELDRIKAELAEEIKAQLAAVQAPAAPVETVIEKVIVDKDVDEATLARIRATEIAAEALEGDIAYVENRVLGLVDGIRYDLNKLQDQVDELEIPALDEIEALIAERIEEGLLAAADVALEPTVIEKVVVMEAELTEEDVELIAQELIAQQVQKYVRLIVDAFTEDIAELNERVAALEAAQADVATKEEVAAVQADVDAVKADVKELQKIKWGGSVSVKGEYKKDDNGDKKYFTSQTLGFNLSLKPSDSVDVGFDVRITDGAFDPWKVKVTTDQPIKSLTVGKWSGNDKVGIGNANVLPSANYELAALADLDLIKDLKTTVLLGLNGETDPLVAGLALDYKFIPELGVKAAVAAEKVPTVKPEATAVGAGIYGDIGKLNYGADIAMDLDAEEDNTRFDLKAGFEVGPLSLDGAYSNTAKNFRAKGNQVTTIEAGVGTDALLGIDLAGRFYRETKDEDLAVVAYILTANKVFDLGALPITVDARYASAVTDPDDDDNPVANTLVKVGTEKTTDGGLTYGASAAYERNILKDGNWKGYGDYGDKTAATITGKLGYKFDWRGAALDLGYNAELKKDLVEEGEVADPTVLTHKLTLGYGFTSSVKLDFGTTITQTLADPTTNDFSYNAGLSISF